MGLFGIFSDENNSNSNSTTSSNTSNTTTTNTSYNTSSNTSDNRTNTLTQDRRLVNDGGYGVSADNSTVTTFDSGNSWSTSSDSQYSNSVDNHSWYNDQSSYNYTNIMQSDFGAISAAKGIADSAIGSNSKLTELMLAATSALANTGQRMFDSNLAYAKHVADQNKTTSEAAISEVKSASANALSQVAAIASKPLDAQNPQHILVIVGLVVFGIYFFKGVR